MLDGAGRRTNLPGYSAECVSGHHSECHDSDCRCLCSAHPRNLEMMQKKPVVQVTSTTGTSLVCPKCARVPRLGDRFCRDDGEKLTAGKLCQCGHAGEIGDSYCPFCGQKFAVPVIQGPELSDEEIAALEAKARLRPSDVEVPPTGIH
jgi:hypothetical protein